ncbi:MAG: bifunctional YncE family protein/alkaline phosphatase family protein [Verrucomicrobia bacterium]|nr:bifunctional YncE family protein/alkaline phosphatase family protein [Verrucomicrobiota bacterium]
MSFLSDGAIHWGGQELAQIKSFNSKENSHMMWRPCLRSRGLVTSLLLLACGQLMAQQSDTAKSKPIFVTNGQEITPTAAPGSNLLYLNPGLTDFPNYIASGGISTAVSPDGNTLLVLTAGYNNLDNSAGSLVAADSQEYIFVFDISKGTPTQKQVLHLPNSYTGIAFAPSGQTFLAAGGVDDNVHIFQIQDNGQWADTGTPVALGHTTGVGLVSDGLALTAGQDPPVAGGVAIVPNTSLNALVTNVYNDSVSLIAISGTTGQVLQQLDLRPGKVNPQDSGKPGGEYPFWVTVTKNGTAYISSVRDREVDVVQVTGSQLKFVTRIPVSGNPNKMILDTAGNLYVAEDNSDQVDVINTSTNQVVNSISLAGPKNVVGSLDTYHGFIPNGLTLSSDGKTLYVTVGGTNSLAVVDLTQTPNAVVGLVPTGYYPSDVSVSKDGKTLYVVNAKSVTGPDPDYFPKNTPAENASNQYIEKDEKSSLLSFPVPDSSTLAKLTRQVAKNDNFGNGSPSKDDGIMKELHKRIKHVIYIIKENRTYDQVLGDLDRGNGDPYITEFGQAYTPSQHALATYFVDADNFYCSGDVSANGWPWSTSGRESDFGTKSVPLNYGSNPDGKTGSRGTDYEYEGDNRELNVGYGKLADRIAADPATPTDPDILPGTGNVAAPDGPGTKNTQAGYIWDAVQRAGLKVRDYGMFIDLTRYSAPQGITGISIPEDPNAFQDKVQVSWVTMPELQSVFDPYFRGFDNVFPDFYRETEWEREFSGYESNNQLPSLELVRFMHDHTGNFSTALNGVNTVELQQADNDYAVGALVEALSKSPYADDTLVFVLEDDAQDGADHVDAHRSIFFVAGPYVKHGAVVSTPYTTVNLLRTIEDILGTDHLNIHTATAAPMSDLFDLSQKKWDFKAIASDYLKNTTLPIPSGAYASKATPRPTHDAKYWADKTKGFDFSVEDHLGNVEKFNRIVWEGLKGSAPYPTQRTGIDLRENRQQLLFRAATAASAGS